MSERIKTALAGFFGKNAVKKALTWLVIVAVATVVVTTQFAFPLRISYRNVRAYRYTDSFQLNIAGVYQELKADSENKTDSNSTTTSVDSKTDSVDSNTDSGNSNTSGDNKTGSENKTQTINENTVLLSDTDFDMSNPDDYLRIELAFDFDNIGMYKLSDIQFSIKDIGQFRERFVFKEANFANINRFSSGKVALYLVIYDKGMTMEEINQALSSIKVEYSCNRPELFPFGGEIELPPIKLNADLIMEEKSE